MLVIVTLLSGCTAVLFNNSGTSQAASSDRAITANVKAALIRDTQVNAFKAELSGSALASASMKLMPSGCNITVSTYQRVVTLRGYALIAAQRTRAINISQSIGRVKYVVSQLHIKE